MDFAGKNILIVDDQQFVRYALIKELEEDQRFNIDGVGSGLEAIEMVKEKRYDLIFVDLVMPKMNGVETCKQLKELSPHSKFVCFTGIFDRVLTARGADYIEAGGRTRLLYKPFRARAFIETAQQILADIN